MSLVSTVTAPNPVSEIQAPFRINPSTGMVNVMSDPLQIAIQHIMAICFTIPGERIMNPDYGVGIQNLLFENADQMEFQAIAIQVQNQLAQDSQDFYDVQVTVQSSPSNPGTFVFAVSFTLYSDNQVHFVIFDYQGNVIGES